ncbi:hypothetical protein NEF87_003141 [Candidatus Lokiarchaeum ossiferum]|uniref:Leucine-rich repeat domain-containing protein n=1 Tax=Candidatus Lokiarchaeum ossiferum TaxID=2951803 RepID=A0ABY6HTL2_9ARCH|nr:hypothetical protein NEF87_003141 [Candidatus Lokiarchaeum sp. B-35]
MTWDTFGFIDKENRVIKLGLYHNSLTSLPDIIGNLTLLEELYFSSDQIPFLPESIRNLISLKEIHLSFSSFSSIPEKIKKWLKELKKMGCIIYYELKS